jgi:hypothetical protein
MALSQPGQMCLSHVNINSDMAKKFYVTDIANLSGLGRVADSARERVPRHFAEGPVALFLSYRSRLHLF